MSPTLDVVTLGEAMLMLVADEPGPLEQVQRFHKRTAGAETNVAIGLARLGLRVGWGSRLGADSMGRYLLAEMQREGIDCSRVELTTRRAQRLPVQGPRHRRQRPAGRVPPQGLGREPHDRRAAR